MRSDLLQLAGVRAGDVLIVDMSLAPRDGDVVVAQQEIGAGARTLIRLWQQPNLVAAALDPTAARPLAVDGETIRIAGVMTDLLRCRS
jgi:SOS-response transcriptional repressor LexA